MPQEDEIKIRSYEVQDVVGMIPPWIVRWGSSIILLTVLVMLFMSYIIKYPDIVSARITITTHQPPVDLIAKTSGKITALLVNENEEADSGRILAVIEGVADYPYVLHLDSLLNHTDETQLKLYGVSVFNPSAQMGELQNDYSTMLKTLEDLAFFNDAKYLKEQESKLEREIEYQEKLNQSYQSQKRSVQREMDLNWQKFQNDKSLFIKGVISSRELNESEANYLRVKNQKDNIEVNISSGNITKENLKRQLNDLHNNAGEASISKNVALSESLNNMRSRIAAWKNNYLITAPISGRISLHSYKTANQFVEAGKLIMTVVPKDDRYIGRIQLPIKSSGKVKQGQKVIIKLDNYPYEEFGSMSGSISGSSLVPKENYYLVEVALQGKGSTSYGKDIELKQEMQGQADIITQDKRLIEKIFNQFKYLYRSNQR